MSVFKSDADLMLYLRLCVADNVKVGADGSVITITDARPLNHGAYRCVASNLFGITHTIVSLIVKGKAHLQTHISSASLHPNSTKSAL